MANAAWEVEWAAAIHAEQQRLGSEYRQLKRREFEDKFIIMDNAIVRLARQPHLGVASRSQALREVKETGDWYRSAQAHIKSLIYEDYKHEVSEEHPEMRQVARDRVRCRVHAVLLTELISQRRDGDDEGADPHRAAEDLGWTDSLVGRFLHIFFPATRLAMVATAATADQSSKLERQVLGNQCPVCWGPYQQLTRLGACGHLFCFSCIMQSLCSNMSCPVCRDQVHLLDVETLDIEWVREDNGDEVEDDEEMIDGA
ncbi:hypothetical protein M409DRAFT_22195 [Zasmidium cellare ATCC 36951]|uniref:RING-type domain-containing protein n=1 Tax=Zasmidium cellare ATCC 36951 TaxID=1080233 RepID=A0A6A6CJQ1_ZASCE|nr:uncharacterized protein M409DRAFT_22195 [Zasmidium cellare ATCC 36951]KAF2167385.1 hypothetical protein M409DRAFT_22195 [Zasmidium cellare ATCC 36951]